MKLTNVSAFSLVEVTLALGVATFSLVSIFALVPIGLNSNQNSVEQTRAASITSSVVSDLRATPRTSPSTDQKSPRFKITVPASASAQHTLYMREDGSVAQQGSVVEDQDANPALNPRFRVTLKFTPPSNTNQRTAETVSVLVSWPALADRSAASSPKNFSGSFETIAVLDRN